MKIVSLEERRKQHNKKILQTVKTDKQRISELEQHLITLSVLLDELTVEQQTNLRLINKILDILKHLPLK